MGFILFVHFLSPLKLYQIRLVEFTIIHRVIIDNKQLLSVPRPN